MIGQDWKISSPFFLAENLVLLVWKIPLENLENSAHGKSGGKSGKLDLLADWRKIWQAEKSAENLADPVKRKIWKIQNMENLENLTRKICGKFPQSGKSGKSADPVQLRKICGKIGKSGKSENVKYI